jgi:hypothetical protein
LEEAFRTDQILKAMFTQIQQGHICGQMLACKLRRKRREQHLSSMRGGHDSCGAVEDLAMVVTGAQLRFTCVQPHTYFYL